jgi:hypothetical protein
MWTLSSLMDIAFQDRKAMRWLRPRIYAGYAKYMIVSQGTIVSTGLNCVAASIRVPLEGDFIPAVQARPATLTWHSAVRQGRGGRSFAMGDHVWLRTLAPTALGTPVLRLIMQSLLATSTG